MFQASSCPSLFFSLKAKMALACFTASFRPPSSDWRELWMTSKAADDGNESWRYQRRSSGPTYIFGAHTGFQGHGGFCSGDWAKMGMSRADRAVGDQGASMPSVESRLNFSKWNVSDISTGKPRGNRFVACERQVGGTAPRPNDLPRPRGCLRYQPWITKPGQGGYISEAMYKKRNGGLNASLRLKFSRTSSCVLACPRTTLCSSPPPAARPLLMA